MIRAEFQKLPIAPGRVTAQPSPTPFAALRRTSSPTPQSSSSTSRSWPRTSTSSRHQSSRVELRRWENVRPQQSAGGRSRRTGGAKRPAPATSTRRPVTIPSGADHPSLQGTYSVNNGPPLPVPARGTASVRRRRPSRVCGVSITRNYADEKESPDEFAVFHMHVGKGCMKTSFLEQTFSGMTVISTLYEYNEMISRPNKRMPLIGHPLTYVLREVNDSDQLVLFLNNKDQGRLYRAIKKIIDNNVAYVDISLVKWDTIQRYITAYTKLVGIYIKIFTITKADDVTTIHNRIRIAYNTIERY